MNGRDVALVGHPYLEAAHEYMSKNPLDNRGMPTPQQHFGEEKYKSFSTPEQQYLAALLLRLLSTGETYKKKPKITQGKLAKTPTPDPPPGPWWNRDPVGGADEIIGG